jgi:archaemetzincin
MSECKHSSLLFRSVDTVKFKYRPPPKRQRLDALRVSQPAQKKRKTDHGNHPELDGKTTKAAEVVLPPETIFPAPMTVPDDELALDPKYPPQPVQEWLDADYRNHVTAGRNVIYVAAPPRIPKGLSHVNKWTIPATAPASQESNAAPLEGNVSSTPLPSIGNVIEYLQAFYHGLEVKLLKDPALEWVAWESSGKPSKSKKGRKDSRIPDCIGLLTGKEMIRVQSRPSPDGVFSGQLNQNHLLEVAIDIVPKDAYALLMVLHHDLYEDEDDDFCCGRAYGGSRVAVVSTARYRPELDAKQKIDLAHVWPASHCARYVGSFFSNKTPATAVEDKDHPLNALQRHPGSAIAAAVGAHNKLPTPSSPSELSALWLGRICKTASHEIGHCFGMDHCVYWACSLQGTSHITEDHRQPPYLCPVDLAKVLRATGADEVERYKALMKFCDKWKGDRMFAAYGAWIRSLLEYYQRS